MTAEEILLKYQKQGVELYLDDMNLRYRAYKNILTEEDKQLLRENKSGIVKYLSNHSDSRIIVDDVNKYEKFPLTDIQTSYFLGQKGYYQYGGTSCKVYTEIEFERLDLEAVQRAWECVVCNNDMLHAVIEEPGVQRILKVYDVPRIVCEDFSLNNELEVEYKIKEKRNKIINKEFEIGTWPLFSLEITRLENKDILHFALDMLVADFVSVNIILNQFEQAYYNKEVLSSKLCFRDIVIYRENIKDTPEGRRKYEQDKNYWKEKILNMAEPPLFPIEEKEQDSTLFTQYIFYLNEEEYSKLCEVSKEKCVTPSSVILTAYVEILRAFSKNKAFCIDVTISDRPQIHSEISKVVGDFTIADILEIKEKEYENYLDEIKDIQEELWNDLSHNTFSSREVIRELGKKLKKEIIVPVVYTSTLGSMQEYDKRKGKIVYTISQTPQVLIDCQVLEVEGKLRVNWDVRCGIFPHRMIEEMFEMFTEKICGFIHENGLEKNICTELSKSVEKRRKEVNSTERVIENKYIYDGFLETLRDAPDSEALYADGKTYSYREVASYVKCLQEELIKKGVGKNDIVAIGVSRGIWQIAAVLATLTLGGIYLPIDIHQPAERVEKILETAKVKCCIFENPAIINKDIIDKIIVSSVEKRQYNDGELYVLHTDTKSPAYIIFTSGSTGMPKGVVISHEAAVNTILDINDKFNLKEQDRILNLANLSFDLSVYDIFGAFFAGAKIVQISEDKRKDPSHWYELIKTQGVTVYNSVPGQMKMLTMFLEGKEKVVLTSVKTILLSGDWIPIELTKEIVKFFVNAQVVSLGGATEAAIWSIYHSINSKATYRRSIPYGKPLSNQKFYILNDKFEEIPNWVTGDIYIAGKGLALEYLGDKELTEKKFIYSEKLQERLYRTGDVGRYMPDGNIEFQGRSDFQVKVRGHRIELGEIEAAILEIVNLKNLKVIAVKNKEVVNICMFGVLENGEIEISKQEMDRRLGKKLPSYMLPSLYIYLDTIPLTSNGKIDIKYLTSMAIENIENNRKLNYDYKNLSEVEKNVHEVWCEIFEIEEVSIDEDFFDCGGDSILIVKLITELKQRYKYEIALEDVYAGPTIRQISKCISECTRKI